VLVLDHGTAIGLGTHRELLDGCPLYREICLTQLRPEELGRDEAPLAGARGGDI
jgi:ATP-binding cassette subfamily B protein